MGRRRRFLGGAGGVATGLGAGGVATGLGVGGGATGLGAGGGATGFVITFACADSGTGATVRLTGAGAGAEYLEMGRVESG